MKNATFFIFFATLYNNLDNPTSVWRNTKNETFLENRSDILMKNFQTKKILYKLAAAQQRT